MPELFFSTDIETDGPIPGPNSMLSFATAVYTPDKQVVGTFSANLDTLPGADGDPKTMAWWESQPDAWAACRSDLRPPEETMPAYVDWVKSFDGSKVFVAYPAGFDFTWVYWYMIRFAGESPFSHSALDIKTYAMAMMHKPYRKCVKREMPKRWFDPMPHTHVALDDAVEQGAMFCNMLAEHQQNAE